MPTRNMSNPTAPRFPLYIISKGRAETRYTAKALERMGVPFRIVVEEAERDAYAAVIDPARILILDPEYLRSYDTVDDLGDTKPKGAGPARNFVWDHAISEGAEWHWIADDNIKAFYRLNYNLKVPVSDGTIFFVMEDFVLRYENVAMAGPNYFMFASRKSEIKPFTPNTRIYSCNLIRNDIPYRWRGRLNEDTILSLDILKDGWCTILFNAFLQEKMQTQTVSGGNTTAYRQDGTLLKSQLLAACHPEVTKIVWRWGRPHHFVDYTPFKRNRLLRRGEVEIAPGVNNYGMRLKKAQKKAPAARAGAR